MPFRTYILFLTALFIAVLTIFLYLVLVEKHITLLVSGIVVGILVVLSFVSLILWSILSPLEKVKKTLERVGKGDLEARVPRMFLKELQEVGEAVGVLAAKVKQEREQVEEAKATLEIRVRARTRELEEFAEAMEEKVAARTKELELKVRELERFQRLAVGRELKMVELKKEIAALQKQKKMPRGSGRKP